MPEQSAAATEHSILQDVAAPLAHLPDDPVSIAADADFPVVLRGYERTAVEAYVQRTSRLIAELQATRSPEMAVRRALERVGEEVTGILRRAHETAEQVTAQSRRDAEDRLETAHMEAERITALAEERQRALDAETDRIWEERRRIVDDARELAEDLLGLVDSATERFAPETPEAHDDVSADAPKADASRAEAPIRLVGDEEDEDDGEEEAAEAEPGEVQDTN